MKKKDGRGCDHAGGRTACESAILPCAASPTSSGVGSFALDFVRS